MQSIQTTPQPIIDTHTLTAGAAAGGYEEQPAAEEGGGYEEQPAEEAYE
jgi:hypothetical protein